MFPLHVAIQRDNNSITINNIIARRNFAGRIQQCRLPRRSIYISGDIEAWRSRDLSLLQAATASAARYINPTSYFAARFLWIYFPFLLRRKISRSGKYLETIHARAYVKLVRVDDRIIQPIDTAYLLPNLIL